MAPYYFRVHTPAGFEDIDNLVELKWNTMLSTPKTEQRSERHYVAIRATVSMNDIPTVLPPLIPEVRAWLKKNNIAPDGPPFFQYLKMDSNNQLLTEVGIPVKDPVKGDDRVIAGSFPAGLYATLTHTGHYMGLPEAHKTLDTWVKNSGLKEKHRVTADGIEGGTRTESYITDPEKEPNPDKWRTDVSLLLATV